MVREEYSDLLSIRRISWSEPELTPQIKADKLSILRILRNLVDNAIKYGGEDLKKINVGYRESDEFHLLSVDDGKGEHAFDLEVQLQANLEKAEADRKNFKTPDYIAKAIKWACSVVIEGSED